MVINPYSYNYNYKLKRMTVNTPVLPLITTSTKDINMKEKKEKVSLNTQLIYH